jgi:hypothetical protein
VEYGLSTLKARIPEGSKQSISITRLVESSPTRRYSNFQREIRRWFCCYGRMFEGFKSTGASGAGRVGFNKFLLRRAIGTGKFERTSDSFFLRAGPQNDRMDIFIWEG